MSSAGVQSPGAGVRQPQLGATLTACPGALRSDRHVGTGEEVEASRRCYGMAVVGGTVGERSPFRWFHEPGPKRRQLGGSKETKRLQYQLFRM